MCIYSLVALGSISLRRFSSNAVGRKGSALPLQVRMSTLLQSRSVPDVLHGQNEFKVEIHMRG